jgi:hypothetical protein
VKSLPAISDDLARQAYTVGNGEIFWPLGVAPAVAKEVAALRLAIVGGEIYFGRGRAWGSMELEWAPPGWCSCESWPDYVARGLADALAGIDRAREMVRDGDSGDVREPMCFFVVCSEADYLQR